MPDGKRSVGRVMFGENVEFKTSSLPFYTFRFLLHNACARPVGFGLKLL